MDLHGKESFYELLGVARNATPEQIKTAYKDLARIYHPDSAYYKDIIDTPITEKDLTIYKTITCAYETLSDSEKRTEYDNELAQAISSRVECSDEEWSTSSPVSEPTREPKPTAMYTPPSDNFGYNTPPNSQQVQESLHSYRTDPYTAPTRYPMMIGILGIITGALVALSSFLLVKFILQ